MGNQATIYYDYAGKNKKEKEKGERDCVRAHIHLLLYLTGHTLKREYYSQV